MCCNLKKKLSRKNLSGKNAPVWIVASLLSTCELCLRSKESSCENILKCRCVPKCKLKWLMDRQVKALVCTLNTWFLEINAGLKKLKANIKWRCYILMIWHKQGWSWFSHILDLTITVSVAFSLTFFPKEIFSCELQTSHQTEANQLCKRKKSLLCSTSRCGTSL